MKKTFIIFATILSFTLYSCTNNTNQAVEHEELEEHSDQHEHEHDAENSEAIELNEGSKWVINEEMKPHITAGEELVEEYINSGSTEYQKLAKDLKIQNKNLISSCTMQGKSHDELHKWLHPHLELVDKLEKEEDADNAVALVHEIHASYTSFHDFFQ